MNASFQPFVRPVFVLRTIGRVPITENEFDWFQICSNSIFFE